MNDWVLFVSVPLEPNASTLYSKEQVDERFLQQTDKCRRKRKSRCRMGVFKCAVFVHDNSHQHR